MLMDLIVHNQILGSYNKPQHVIIWDMDFVQFYFDISYTYLIVKHSHVLFKLGVKSRRMVT